MATAAPHIRDLAKQQRRNLRALLLAVLVILVAVLPFAGHLQGHARPCCTAG